MHIMDLDLRKMKREGKISSNNSVLFLLYVIYHFIFSVTHEVGTTIIPILHMRKLRLGKDK